MINFLKYIWSKIRIKKRLYLQGEFGLKWFDDRTSIEKLCDWVDKRLAILERAIMNRQKDRVAWHTFFEPCTGKWISSMDDIKRIERETGMVYLKPSEIHYEAEKALKYRKQESFNRTRKVMEQKYRELKQGRSFVKEIKQGIKKGDYFVNPNVRAFN